MQDRDIFNDLLSGTKHSINSYTMAIQETDNQQLRSTWQTLRTEAEQMQYQIYQMAEQKGYYVPAPQADQNDIQKIKSSFSAVMNPVGGGAIEQNMMQGNQGKMQQQATMNQTMQSSMKNKSMTDISGSANTNDMNMTSSTAPQQKKNKK